MKVTSLGANRTEIETDNKRILISYQTPVAAWIAGQGYMKTSKKWSRTTSKHITQWIDGPAQEQEQTFFDTLLEG
jgi:hypothetical protein